MTVGSSSPTASARNAVGVLPKREAKKPDDASTCEDGLTYSIGKGVSRKSIRLPGIEPRTFMSSTENEKKVLDTVIPKPTGCRETPGECNGRNGKGVGKQNVLPRKEGISGRSHPSLGTGVRRLQSRPKNVISRSEKTPINFAAVLIMIGLVLLLAQSVAIFTLDMKIVLANDTVGYERTVLSSNLSRLPTPYQLVGEEYGIDGTILLAIQNTGIGRTEELEARGNVQKKSSKSASFETASNSSSVYTTHSMTIHSMSESSVTVDISPWEQQEGDYCKGLHYFYELHIKYARKHGTDWFQDQVKAYNKRAVVSWPFYPIPILAWWQFILIPSAIFNGLFIGCRAYDFRDNILPAYICQCFIVYVMSCVIYTPWILSSLAIRSSAWGLRCAMCRFSLTCEGSGLWDSKGDKPLELFVISSALKFVSVYLHGILVILCTKNASGRLAVVKIISLMFVVPLCLATPTLGVLRYKGFLEYSPIASSVVVGFFSVGVFIYGLPLIILLGRCFYTQTRKHSLHKLHK